jgi:hypothetical protein
LYDFGSENFEAQVPISKAYKYSGSDSEEHRLAKILLTVPKNLRGVPTSSLTLFDLQSYAY